MIIILLIILSILCVYLYTKNYKITESIEISEWKNEYFDTNDNWKFIINRFNKVN